MRLNCYDWKHNDDHSFHPHGCQGFTVLLVRDGSRWLPTIVVNRIARSVSCCQSHSSWPVFFFFFFLELLLGGSTERLIGHSCQMDTRMSPLPAWGRGFLGFPSSHGREPEVKLELLRTKEACTVTQCATGKGEREGRHVHL